MQNIKWEMMTQFVFPEELGTVEEVISVNIKPRWQQVETEESIRLVGIYHITSVVRFDPAHLREYCEGTLIEHLEFDENDGYFEYALPLEVDLPKEKIAQDTKPELFVDDVAFFVYDGSCCKFEWQARCIYQQAEPSTVNNPANPILSEEDSSSSSSVELVNKTEEQEVFGREKAGNEPLAVSDELSEIGYGDENINDHYKLSLETDSANLSEKVEQNYQNEVHNYPNEVEDEIIVNANDAQYQDVIINNSNFEYRVPTREDKAKIKYSEVKIDNDIVEIIEVQSDQRQVLNATDSDSVFNPDDFFSELSESYTLLNLTSNKIIEE